MKTQALRRFVELAQAGSFYQAARQSDITAQGFFKALNSLEKELGVSLASRNQSGIHLTRAGVILLEYASEALSQFDRTLEMIYDSVPEVSKRQSQVDIYLTHWAAQIVSRLDYLHTKLATFRIHEVRFDKMLAKLSRPKENEIFIAEVFSNTMLRELKPKGVVFTPYCRMTLGVAVRNDSSLSKKCHLHRSMLENVPLSIYSQVEHIHHIGRLFREFPLKNIAFESTGVNMLLDFAKERQDRAFLVDSLRFYVLQKDSDYDVEGLCFIPLAAEEATYQNGFLSSQEYPHSLRIQHIINELRELSKTYIADYFEKYPLLS